VESAIRTGTTLSPRDYEALVRLSNSTNFDTQINALDEIEERATEELEAAWAELARDNYIDFYEYCVRDEGFTCSPHQTLIGEMLMAAERRELMRGMISMPPGHCKSTHCSHHFPAWYLGRNQKAKFLQAGHSQDFVANEIGAKVKSIIDTDDFRRVFPGVRLRQDLRAKDAWGLSNMKGKYVAKGVGQGISGFRGNFGQVDDPYKSRKDAESQTIRDSTFKWYSDDFATRLLPGSPLFIVMTRWHSDDLCGRITDREEKERREELEKQQAEIADAVGQADGQRKTYKFEIINLPAIAEDENDVLGRRIGEPLWEELFDLDALANLRADMTAASWNSLYQGTPMDVTGGAILPEWFKRYDALPSKGDQSQPNQIRRTVISVDSANTAKERSDYTVIGVWIEDVNRNHYLADVIRKQVEFNDMCVLIDQTAKRWERITGRIDALLVEAKGNGLAYVQLKASGGAPAPLIAIEVGNTDKEFRFDKVSPMFESGAVHLPNRSLWLADYEKELIAFPNGKNDDQVDMTSQYLDWARKKGRRGTKKLGGTGHA
jgi:predicted phage terminase large subunit-like protein